jgi:hypothetical protein
MAKKKVIYARPEIGKEEFVRHIFSLYAKDLGFEILNIQKAFPDCEAIDLRNNGKRKVFIEFEYEAQNFVLHGHGEQMFEEAEHVVVCWSGKGIDLVPSTVEVIVLSDKKYGIEIAEYPEVGLKETEKPQYRIIGYNTEVAGGKEFSVFENTKMFRTNIKFKDDFLPKGSVIVLYERGWLIGEFTVASYIYIERPPKTTYEETLYQLVSYPVTIDTNPLKYGKWLKGHIIYTDFKVYDPQVDFDILERNMSRGGSLVLTFDELQMIRGKKKVF